MEPNECVCCVCGWTVSYIEISQKHVRGLLVRLRMQYWREQNAAAARIQRWWYRELIRIELQGQAAVQLQCWWRLVWARVLVRRRLDAVLQLQSITRHWMQRRQHHQAATRIQAAWRGFLAQVNWQVDWLDICTVQACVRRYLARRERQRRAHAVACLQRIGRRYLHTRQCRQEHQAALRIQVSVWCVACVARTTKSNGLLLL